MGREELAALVDLLTKLQEEGLSSPAIGTWKIEYDKKRSAFVFDKCEADGYCEERPVVIALDGRIIDPGGPLFD